MHVGLGEDGLEVVLHSVLGQEHQLGELSSVVAGHQVIQQLGLPCTEPEDTGEQLRAPGC